MIRHSSATEEQRQTLREYERRYAEAFPKWRGYRSLTRCPRWVARKRCLWATKGDRNCLCEKSEWRAVLDHGRKWVNRTGYRVLTGEPYGLYPGVLSEIFQDADALGLEVWMYGYSPHNPGETMLIVIQQKGAAPLQLRGRTYLPDYSIQGA